MIKAVIEQGKDCMTGKLNPNAFDIEIYNGRKLLDVIIVNEITVKGKVIGKYHIEVSKECGKGGKR
mgnify:CR=1 FL=1